MTTPNKSSLSPQSLQNNIPAKRTPDPTEIANLLEQISPRRTNDGPSSRESTPNVVVDAQGWIAERESLRNTITALKRKFNFEEWRRKNIIDPKYWQTEADHFERCYWDNFNQGHEQSEHQEVIYHQHRSILWEKLCEMRGYPKNRMSIKATEYWRTETYLLYDEKNNAVTEHSRKRNGSARGNARPQRIVNYNEKPPSRQYGENQILVESQARTSGKGRFLSKQSRHRAAIPSKTNPNFAKPAVLLDDNARIRKRRQRDKSSMDCAPDPPRRSSRLADRPEKVY